VTDGTVIGTPSGQIAVSFLLLAMVVASLTAAPGPDGLLGAFLAALMLAIALVDGRRYLIPNELTGAAALLALLRAAAVGPEADLQALLQALAWTACRGAATAVPLLALMLGYRRWRGRDGLGLGDIKLAAVAGLWLNFVTIFAVIELATLSALGAYFVNGYLRKRPLKATALLPFGLFLAPAIWIGWLVEAMFG
jgi:leader peptidase (prepilin peptidase)/N-methyltransferase